MHLLCLIQIEFLYTVMYYNCESVDIDLGHTFSDSLIL